MTDQRNSRLTTIGRRLMTLIAIVIAALLVLVLAGWVGLQIKPDSFPALEQPPGNISSVPLPDDLPPPVERFYRQLYGEDVPVFETAVVTGHMQMRVQGITFPGRFRFIYQAGQGYRHYIEATLFGRPLLKVNEYYLDGRARLELPFGVSEGSQVDQAANLGLWAEAVWFPAIWLTDSRVSWQAVDTDTAILIVPFGDDQQHFVARFNPETGLLHMLESMRYKAQDDAAKTLWLNAVQDWGEINGTNLPTTGALTWLDEGKPWAVFEVTDVRYNVAVEEAIRTTGP